MGPSLPPSLRILCFGASITAGFYRFGLAYHPYAVRLEERLKNSLPSTKITIDVDALPGDTVIGGEYFSRLRPRCSRDSKNAYDWIIVQGGGNDLGFGHPPERIYEELKNVWKVALNTGARVMALTVTETSDRSTPTRTKYQALNKMIMGHREDRFYVADVCGAIPWPDNETEQRRIWDDGLHFRKAGYDMLGDAIGHQVLDSFQRPQTTKI